jgi:8-oxo-dGTP diphosphatase
MTVGARRRTRVATYALCLDGEQRILLCRIAPWVSIGGKWTLPGGGLEFGEDPAAGVLRELEEETGLLGEIDGIASVVSRFLPQRSWADGEDVHNLSILYRVRIVGGTLRDETDGSSDACGWFTHGEAKELPLWQLADEGLRLTFNEDAHA